jgi:hypothetical protein
MVVQSLSLALFSLLAVVAMSACAKGPASPPSVEPTLPSATAAGPTSTSPTAATPTNGATPPPAPGTAAEIAELRKALRGAPLTDAEVLFVHRSLLASKTEYTERGLWTFREWSLGAEVTRSGDTLKLFVAGEKVNAEWELTLFPDGKVKQGAVFTR